MIITLSNRRRVANFSSPHPFLFEDGSVLPAADPEEAERLKVDFIEEPVRHSLKDGLHRHEVMEGDIELRFLLTSEIDKQVDYWLERFVHSEVDIVYCPLPMIIVLKKHYGRNWLIRSPFRAVRMENRIKKIVSITKQCL